DARIFATHRRCSCGARRASRHLLRGDRLPRVRFVRADAANAVRQPRSRHLQASAWHRDQSSELRAIRVRAGHLARLDRAASRDNRPIGAGTTVRGGQDQDRAKNEAPNAATHGTPERTAQSHDGLCVPALLRWVSIVVLKFIQEGKPRYRVSKKSRIVTLAVAVLVVGAAATASARPKKHTTEHPTTASTPCYGTPVIMQGMDCPQRPARVEGQEPNKRAKRPQVSARGSSTYVAPFVPPTPSLTLTQPSVTPYIPPPINNPSERVMQYNQSFPF